MSPVKHRDEQRLVADVIKGDPAAISRFIDLLATVVWTAVVALVGDGPAGEKAAQTIAAALQADGFARLARYDGRSRLSTFLTFVSRDILAEDLTRAFSVEPNQAWRRFERFFGADIRRCIGRRFSRATTAECEDHYQKVCLALVERDYHRIRAFDGRGSFGGYILATVVHNLLTDLVRQEVPRLRPPADIARMSPLHQAIFAACVRGGVALDVQRIAEAIRGKIAPEPRPDEVAAVLDELAGTIAAARGSSAKPKEISIDGEDGIAEALTVASPSATPEDLLIEKEEQRAREAFLNHVKRESEALPNADRLFFNLAYQSTDPLPPREIAKLMAIPVDDVYRLQQRVERWIKQNASSLQKNASLSVS